MMVFVKEGRKYFSYIYSVFCRFHMQLSYTIHVTFLCNIYKGLQMNYICYEFYYFLICLHVKIQKSFYHSSQHGNFELEVCLPKCGMRRTQQWPRKASPHTMDNPHWSPKNGSGQVCFVYPGFQRLCALQRLITQDSIIVHRREESTIKIPVCYNVNTIMMACVQFFICQLFSSLSFF